MRKLSWHIEQRKISELIAWDKNPRFTSDKDKADLDRSISKFDYVEIVIINTDNKIIGGHQRIDRLRAAGRQEEVIDVRVPNRKLSPKEFEELAIRLNKNRGQWDEEKLAEFFDSAELQDWGFDEAEITKIYDDVLESSDDEFNLEEELEKIDKPRTKEGDIYALGRHRLICGDSRDPEAWQKLMEGKEGDLQLTDPPYNVDYTGGTEKKMKIRNDKMSDSAFLNFLTAYFKAVNQVLKPGSPAYIFHADSEGLNFRKSFIDGGNKLAQCIVWVKNSIVMGRQDYQWQHEPILYGWKKGGKHRWYSDRKQSTVLNFDRPLRNEEHPTMKPVELIGYLMKNSSAVNQVVVDGFLGSGTTLVCAEQLQRVCYGMELDPVFCDVIVTRWEKLTGKKAALIRSSKINNGQIGKTQKQTGKKAA